MTDTLADTLSAMAREVADAPTLNGERANAWGRLSNCVAANLPAILAALREREAMRAALEAVKEACLFAEDDGAIGVTQEPHIDDELFGRICSALKTEGE